MAANSISQNRIGEQIRLKFGKETPVLTEDIYKKVLGIPKKTFRKYVNNELQPRIDELQRISFWIGVSAKDLF
ncbi:hypothetical protein EMA8858_00520 [Emticicia aquatica]|uniref:XRE family transcriptional regulator n=1 Tax=Emticicia aquatica TaxID=1681835 RepID=A0ABM9ALT1_9BACT|nr:hypothetical protein [Emticicia aquatica]CAH0994411.1 hypothetical protein EMA8858_00520 [Emticicia aquatica]